MSDYPTTKENEAINLLLTIKLQLEEDYFENWETCIEQIEEFIEKYKVEEKS